MPCSSTVMSSRGHRTAKQVSRARSASRANSNAYDLLARDIANVAHYFSRVGVAAEPARLADRMWTRYLRAEL